MLAHKESFTGDFLEACVNKCEKCLSSSAQLLTINMLMSKDLTEYEYFYCTASDQAKAGDSQSNLTKKFASGIH